MPVTAQPDEDDFIYIESTRNADSRSAANPETACLLRWREAEWYAPVAAIRQTAEDLCTCAAYADLIGELLQVGLEPEIMNQMVSGMLRHRRPRYFGGPDTVFMLPAGSSARKQGMVLLSKQNRFHRNVADGLVMPDAARAMARVWLAAAEASDADTLYSAVLVRSGWLSVTETDALFALVNDIRAGNADLPPQP